MATQNDAMIPLAAGPALQARAAVQLYDTFRCYRSRFDDITGQAKHRFEVRDWDGMRADASQRLALYNLVLAQGVAQLGQLLGEQIDTPATWTGMKKHYAHIIAEADDAELAATFFNSATRRIFATVGVAPEMEFVNMPTPRLADLNATKFIRTYPRIDDLFGRLKIILQDFDFDARFQELAGDCRWAAFEIESQLRRLTSSPQIAAIEMLVHPFYRDQAAYLIGRLRTEHKTVPLVLALHNLSQGLLLDTVLMREDDVSILFSYTRAHFHVTINVPRQIVAFLQTLLPTKRVAELYSAIGCPKHGKSELYRDMQQYLSACGDPFEIARGEPGMVMTVINTPDYDMVFKMIKDRFDYPKRTTHQEVNAKYDLVYKHDRAGRLVEAYHFEYLKFDRCWFPRPLLRRLLDEASRNVHLQGDHVVLKQVYVERQVVPLDVYLNNTDPGEARKVVLDYGQAIKDLAMSNIFPGDMLLKNFGVTRFGRVVFYDYDELSTVTDCRFRYLPQSSSDDGDQGGMNIALNDVFPEEFKVLIGVTPMLQELFLAHHADIFDPAFWQLLKKRLLAGEWIQILPYTASKRQIFHRRRCRPQSTPPNCLRTNGGRQI